MREIIISKIGNIGALSGFLQADKNIDYLNFLNKNIPDFSKDMKITEKLWYFIHEIKEPQLCLCGKMLSYIGPKNGYRTSCGNKECYVKNRKKTSMKNWGVDNPRKHKDIIEKGKETILEKYNGKHYMYDDSVRKKFNNTMLDRYGVEWAQQNKDISYKSAETWDNNPNKEEIIENRITTLSNKSDDEKTVMQNKKIETKINRYGSMESYNKHIKEMSVETCLEKYGVKHHWSNKDVINKRINSYESTIENKIKENLPNSIIYNNKNHNLNGTDYYLNFSCKKCGNDFTITRQLFILRKNSNKELCLICNPILSGKSQMELDLLKFIQDNYTGEIITNTKSIIGPTELDIYLPELKLAIEFNGLYWHSELHKDKYFHLNKTKSCENKGIQLIHIWEDDWVYKQDIVKSMILNKLGRSNKIFARKCEIKEIIDNNVIREFLERNHIQGFVGSKVKLGLYYNNELVSLMTFGGYRKNMNSSSQEGAHELLRFCNVLNTSVIGGASKLFKYFVKNYKPIEIISYSDYSRSIGNMYNQLGFKLSHLSEPNYYYIIDEKRIYRFNFRKDILVKQGFDASKTEIEIMHERGYFRLFDCGMHKWIYN